MRWPRRRRRPSGPQRQRERCLQCAARAIIRGANRRRGRAPFTAALPATLFTATTLAFLSQLRVVVWSRQSTEMAARHSRRIVWSGLCACRHAWSSVVQGFDKPAKTPRLLCALCILSGVDQWCPSTNARDGHSDSSVICTQIGNCSDSPRPTPVRDPCRRRLQLTDAERRGRLCGIDTE